ncbi:MAG: hypothetical protein U0805_04975 [Pirellulales bacterium]
MELSEDETGDDEVRAAGQAWQEQKARSPWFKRWFGDWEAASAQQQLDEMKPIKATIPRGWKSLSLSQLQQVAGNKLFEFRNSGVVVQHSRLGPIKFSGKGIKKSIFAGVDPAKLLMVADLPKILSRAVFVQSKPPADSHREHNVKAYHTLGAKVQVGPATVDCLFTIREDNNGNLYYNHRAFASAQKESLLGNPTVLASKDAETTSAYSRLLAFIRRPFERVNADDISKVVNPDGTPKVVYHGTIVASLGVSGGDRFEKLGVLVTHC